MSAATKVPSPMTVAEFLAWNPDDGQSWQLVDGEPRAMAPARNAHAALMIELGAVLRNHFIERGSPCIALGQPGIIPHVNARRNYCVPDLAVTCTDLLRRLPDGSWPKEPEAIATGELSLDSIAFRIPLPALYRTTGFAAP
jgi:Uma2 family endonuclease